jgi:hypothetical protein
MCEEVRQYKPCLKHLFKKDGNLIFMQRPHILLLELLQTQVENEGIFFQKKRNSKKEGRV